MKSTSDGALLREVGIRRDPFYRRIINRLFSRPKLPVAQAEEVPDVRAFEPTSEGSGMFGTWELDANGLPRYHYIVDQYQTPFPTFPNTAGIDRRDHWHQIGNDHITGMVSNDGTVQAYIGDRGGTFLNLFAARDEPALATNQPAKVDLMRIFRQILAFFGTLYFAIESVLQRSRPVKPQPQPTVQYARSSATAPRGVPTEVVQPTASTQTAHEPARFAYSGGFGYLNDGTETWSTAYRYRQPNSDIERFFGMGYAETRITYRALQVTRRIYAPYGDQSFFLVDIEFENTGTTPSDFRYHEYWDINVYQLKLQWLRGDPFSAAGDGERSQINTLFLPKVAFDESANALRFHQQLSSSAYNLDNPSEVDYSPADIFLADLTGKPSGQYTDKYAFFGSGTPSQPQAVQACLDNIPNTASTDSMPYCMVLRRDLTLVPGQKQSQRYAFGTLRPNDSFQMLDPFRQGDPFTQTINAWKKIIPDRKSVV